MFARSGIVLSLCVFLVGASSLGLYAESKRAKAKPEPSLADKVARIREAKKKSSQPTRLQIDVFDLACTTQQLAELDLDKIGSSDASCRQILKKLSDLGEARLLIRIDNIVDLTRESKLSSRQNIPVVTDMTVGGDGKMLPRITYKSIGCATKMVGQWGEKPHSKRAEISCKIEYTDVIKSRIELPSGVTLPSFVEVSFDQKLVVESGKAVLLASSDQPVFGDEKDQRKVTIIRLVVTRMPG